MAKRKTLRTTKLTTPTLEALGLHEAMYMIQVSVEKFDMPKFVAAVGGKKEYAHSGGLIFASSNPDTGEYHARLSWFVADEDVRLRIEYIKGGLKHASDEKPPYAEDFMAWLGGFFKYSTAQAHTHAHLQFSIKSRTSRSPLPLRTAMVGAPEIDGISLKLPVKPEGISRVRISMGLNNGGSKLLPIRESSLIRSPFSRTLRPTRKHLER